MKDNTTRRNFLKGTGAATASAMIGSGLTIPEGCDAASVQAQEPSEMNADEALQELIDGNERFISGKTKHPRMTEDWLKRLTKGQKPFATILACSDSRVPLELLFDQGFGDIFAIRVAGNVVTRYGLGSMQYAQHHLQTPLFVVLGHDGCGAVTAAMLPEEKRAQEPKGVQELLELVHIGKVDKNADPKAQLASAVEANAKNVTKMLFDLDPDEEGLKPREDEMVVTAVYEISTGRVRILDKRKGLRGEKKGDAP